MMLSLKKVLRFMAVLFVMFCICRPAFASDIPITAAYFPDESFRRYVLHGIDTDQNGILSEAEANAVLLIDVRLEFELASLEGISYFPNLERLWCTLTELTTLDVSQNTKLVELYLPNNHLTSLNISGNTLLEELNCEKNNLLGLDLSHNPRLTLLWCGDNDHLGTLDISNNTELESLHCYNCGLTELDLQGITKLDSLNCGNNMLQTLDVSMNPGLTHLGCGSIGLTELDVSANANLSGLGCSDNMLSSLDVSRNVNLTNLSCSGNMLSSLDVSSNAFLTYFYCGKNMLTSLDVSQNPALKILTCEENALQELDVSHNPELEQLICSDNHLSSLDLSRNTKMFPTEHPAENGSGRLYCSNNIRTISLADGETFSLTELPGFDVTKADNWTGCELDGDVLTFNNTTVTYTYDCGNTTSKTFTLLALDYDPGVPIDDLHFPDAYFQNQIRDYDYNANGLLSRREAAEVTDLGLESRGITSLAGIEYLYNLERLNCRYNALQALDVTWNTHLKELDCSVNQMSELDLSACEELITLACYDNLLTELHTDHCPQLSSLNCMENQLSSLDVTHNTNLAELSCDANHLTSLDISKNENLNYLSCTNNQILFLDVSANGNLTELWCSDNCLSYLDLSGLEHLDRLYCERNSHPITPASDGTFSLSSLPGFDPERADNWNGAYFTGDSLTVYSGTVTYEYDLGNGTFAAFVLAAPDFERAVPIDEAHFPDETFRSFVQSKFDHDSDNILSENEADAVERIDLYSYQVSSLAGVSYFMNLEYFSCGDGCMTELDVSRNVRLRELYCGGLGISALDLTHNPELVRLSCDGNLLTALDLSGNPKLTYLSCDNNSLSALDLSHNPLLETLSCHENNLTSLDVSGCPNFTTLYAENNVFEIALDAIYSFDLSALPGFDPARATNWNGAEVNGTVLTAYSERITYEYDCGNGFIRTFTLLVPAYDRNTPIDESSFPDPVFREYLQSWKDTDSDGVLSDWERMNVTDLYVGSKELHSLEGIALFPNVERLDCSFSDLTALDVSMLSKLHLLDVSDNPALNTLILGSAPVYSLSIWGCPVLPPLDLSHQPALLKARMEGYPYTSQYYDNCVDYTWAEGNLKMNADADILLPKWRWNGIERAELILPNGTAAEAEVTHEQYNEFTIEHVARAEIAGVPLTNTNTKFSYKITFEGADVPPQFVLEGECVVCPEPPSRIGSVFEGWYTDSNYYDPYNFDEEVGWALTLYACICDFDPETYIRLPSGIAALEDDAFAGVPVETVIIPRNVTTIQGDPFRDSGVTYICGYPGTAVETFAEDGGYTFVPIDDEWLATLE